MTLRRTRLTKVVAALGLVIPMTLRANDLKIESGTVDRTGANVRVTAKVSWKNAWANAKNHDAVWLFVKVRGAPVGAWRHARIAASSPATNGVLRCQASTDRVGTFCRAGA